jgi:O-antigen/teichoic acid export membrane protein
MTLERDTPASTKSSLFSTGQNDELFDDVSSAGRKVGHFAVINLLGSLVSLLLAIVTVPAYLHMLGQVRYGIWLVGWVLIGYFGIDLGLGRATANAVAKLRSGPATERQTVVATAAVVNLAFGIVFGALALAGTELAISLTGSVTGNLHREVVTAAPWLAATIPLFIVSSVLTGSLEGLERFLLVNVIATLGSVSVQLLPLAAAALIAPRLDVLAAATVVALLGSTTIAAVTCVVCLPVTSRPRFDRRRAKALLKFGGWITVTYLISPLLSTLDKLIIGAVSGARAVTHYTVGFNLVTKLWIFPSALVRSLFPRFSRLAGADARHLAVQSSRALSAIMTPITVTGILAVHPFMRVWVGSTFASAAALSTEILFLGLWVNSLAFVPYTLLQAQGRPDLPAKFHILELPPFLGALWLGIKLGGVAGAATAWSGRVLFDAVLLTAAARYDRRGLAYLFPAVTLVAAAFVAVELTSLTLLARILVGSVLVVASLVWSWHIAPPALRDYVLRFRPHRLRASTR